MKQLFERSNYSNFMNLKGHLLQCHHVLEDTIFKDWAHKITNHLIT